MKYINSSSRLPARCGGGVMAELRIYILGGIRVMEQYRSLMNTKILKTVNYKSSAHCHNNIPGYMRVFRTGAFNH